MTSLEEQQDAVARRFGAVPLYPHTGHRVGISDNVRDGLQPINALRHLPDGDTCGWYIWAGEELSKEPDFFKPLHVSHLLERCPSLLPYLALPPGWRVLVAPGYEDVWCDATLLDI